MKLHYFIDGERLVCVYDESTPEERQRIISNLKQSVSVQEECDASVSPIEVYKGKFINGKYIHKTARQAVDEDGDAAFLWISKHMRSGGISGNSKKEVSDVLNSYLLSRFNIEDPEEYVKNKSPEECDSIITAFQYALPKKLLNASGYSSAEDVLKAETEEKRRFIEGMVTAYKKLYKKLSKTSCMAE